MWNQTQQIILLKKQGFLNRHWQMYRPQDHTHSAIQNGIISVKPRKQEDTMHLDEDEKDQQSNTIQIKAKQSNAHLSSEKQYSYQVAYENPYIRSQTLKKVNLLMSQRIKKSEGIQLPILNQKQKQTSGKNRDFGLTEEEKLVYGDRFPSTHNKLDILGKGGFALVWLASEKKGNSNLKYALKQIAKQNGNAILEREKRFYHYFFQNKNKSHKEGYDNLVEILGIDQTQRDIWIIQELGGKTLSKILYNLKGEFFKGERVYSITETEFTQTFYKRPEVFIQLLLGITKGIQIMQSEGFTHCDIKPENILVKWNSETKQLEHIKIIDFGSSFTLQDQENIGMVTPEYMAPEVLEIIHNWSKYSNHFPCQIEALKQLHQKSNIDVWSLGAVILDMICGIPHWLSYKGKIVRGGKTIVRVGLFSSKGRELDKILQKQGQVINQLEQIVHENAVFLNQKKRAQLYDLLSSILVLNPQERINSQKVLQHEFFL